MGVGDERFCAGAQATEPSRCSHLRVHPRRLGQRAFELQVGPRQTDTSDGG
jgi:hypothetical protein